MSNTPTVPVPQETTMDKLSHFDVVKDWMHVFGKQTSQEKAQDVTNKQNKQSGFIDRNHYRSMATGQPASEEYDKKLANAKVAQTLKNPFEAPNPQLQLTAHGAKLTRLLSDQRFQKLNENNKVMILQHFYNKYTEPILKANGVDPPGFDRWVQGQHAKSYDVSDADQGTKPTIKGAYVSGVVEGTADLSRIVSNGLRYKIPWTPKFTDKINQSAADRVAKFTSALDTMDQSYHSTFQTDHSVSGWLANTGGHVIGEAPAYVLLDAATSGVAPSLEALAKTAPKVAKAIHFMKEGGEIFAIDKSENKKTSVAASDAFVGPLIGFGLRGAAGLVRRPLNAAGDAWLKRINSKGTQIAVMGQPFANTVASEADKLTGHELETIPKAQSFIDKTSPDMQQAAMNEVHLRESVARDYYAHKIDPEKPNASVWRNLSKAQRDKVRIYISELSKTSAETMPLTSPHVQTLANENEIEQWAKSDPSNDAILKSIAKITGINPAEALTEAQAEVVAKKAGVNTATQHINEAFNNEQYEPGEGATATLSPNFRVDFRNRINDSSLSDTVQSDAKNFIHKTIKYLDDTPATDSGKVYFEHPEHHLLWIAKNAKAPSSVKAKALVHLKTEFGENASTVDRRAGWLKEHVDDLRRTGILKSEGNVFRSTKLGQRRYSTSAAQELYTDDTFDAQMRQVKNLIRSQPRLKKVFAPMIKDLIEFKNKGAKSQTVAERAQYLEDAVNKFKKENRIK